MQISVSGRLKQRSGVRGQHGPQRFWVFVFLSFVLKVGRQEVGCSSVIGHISTTHRPWVKSPPTKISTNRGQETHAKKQKNLGGTHSSLNVCIHMYKCMSEYVCVYVWARSQLQVSLLRCHASCVFEMVLHWPVASWLDQAGQQAPGICLSPAPQCSDFQQVPLCSAFSYLGFGAQN